MSRPDEFSFRRYLAAKRTVDDRALHRPTLDRLTERLAKTDGDDDDLRVVDVGAGIGTGLQRLLDWDCLPSRIDYTLLDADASSLDAARSRLPSWAQEVGYRVREEGSDEPDATTLHLTRENESVTVRFEQADALRFAERTSDRWDLLVGQAFVDLFDLDDGLPALFSLVADGGHAYFPITFDGVTAFSPTPDPAFERRLLGAYHATMDAPDRPGASTTGRDLFSAVPDAGGEIVAAGGSDWIVHPPYPADEAYFLHHLIHTVAGAVGGEVSLESDGDGTIDLERLTSWADARHAAVADGKLTYLAHNVDVLVRVERS